MSSAKVARQSLRERLRDHGLRATSARVAVLSLLVQRKAPLSHAEVFESVGDEGYDRATVYRNLIDLVEAGILRRADMGDHVWRFELVADDERHSGAVHPHFVCSECGTVRCLPESAIAIQPSSKTPRALRRNGLEIQLRGRCDACA